MAVETEGTLVVGLATLASGVEGGALGGGEGTGSSVDDAGGTWVKGSVDKAGTLFARLAEDDIARKVWSNRRRQISTCVCQPLYLFTIM